MQTFTSDYGRKGCRVPDRTPTRAIAWRLGQVNVATPEAEVVEMVEAAINHQILTNAAERDDWTPELIRATIRYARWQHAENLAEYLYVMGGHG